MPRRPRGEIRGAIHHVINRGNQRADIFHNEAEFQCFVDAIRSAREIVPVRIYAFCVLNNHFHAVVEPRDIDTLSRFIHRWMTIHAHQPHGRPPARGHIWQDRFRSFPVELTDESFLTVVRYVLQNPVRAGIVDRAEAYPWSSLAHPKLVDPWPVLRPQPFSTWLAAPVPNDKLAQLRASANQQIPYGSTLWRERTARALGRPPFPRHRGRPSKRGQPPFSRHNSSK